MFDFGIGEALVIASLVSAGATAGASAYSAHEQSKAIKSAAESAETVVPTKGATPAQEESGAAAAAQERQRLKKAAAASRSGTQRTAGGGSTLGSGGGL